MISREEAKQILFKCDTWQCVPNKVIDKIYDSRGECESCRYHKHCSIEYELKKRTDTEEKFCSGFVSIERKEQ
jgi:hypothetical protein